METNRQTVEHSSLFFMPHLSIDEFKILVAYEAERGLGVLQEIPFTGVAKEPEVSPGEIEEMEEKGLG